MNPSNFGKEIMEKINITLYTILDKFKNIFVFFIFILIFSCILIFSYTSDGNTPFQSLVSDYGVQIIPFKFYLKDYALKEYEDIFRQKRTAFIPFSKII
jgi:hypothetical protein